MSPYTIHYRIWSRRGAQVWRTRTWPIYVAAVWSLTDFLIAEERLKMLRSVYWTTMPVESTSQRLFNCQILTNFTIHFTFLYLYNSCIHCTPAFLVNK